MAVNVRNLVLIEPKEHHMAKTILITGASSGLGRATVKLFRD